MSHWQSYPARWSEIEPPLRCAAEVVREVQAIAGNPEGKILLLGVTPELANAFEHVLAVDKNPAMIANVWPGDTAAKRAVAGDWLELDLRDGPFAAVIGDGSLNNVGSLSEIAKLLGIVAKALAPGGAFACRLFERPDEPFTIDGIMAMSRGPAPINFHAFKLMLAMHIAATGGATVAVAQILAAFNELFPDRGILSRTTGWPRGAIDTINVYEGSPVLYCFPDRAEFLNMIPVGVDGAAFRNCGTYDLAANCPILTFRKPRV